MRKGRRAVRPPSECMAVGRGERDSLPLCIRSCRSVSFSSSFSVGLPRHVIDARCRVSFESEVAPLQEIDANVTPRRGEPYTLAPARDNLE
jgi:hypothetical protein